MIICSLFFGQQFCELIVYLLIRHGLPGLVSLYLSPAKLMAVGQAGYSDPVAFLVVGVSPAYRTFLHL